MQRTAFLSTTIPYVNARPHLGHAFEYVQADAFARALRAAGMDVYFLSGSDENSLKNVLAAEKLGLGTQELVDANAQFFSDLLERLSIDVNKFIRTSIDEDHLAGAVAIWQRMNERGDIYSEDYEGLYCVGCEQFYTEDELIGGRCPEHGTVPELVAERNYFFALSRYADRLLEEIESGRIDIVPNTRRNEVTSFIKAGLSDISISRSTVRAHGWGIPVPDSPDQVMYVWIDALTNYINALGWTRDSEEYERYWVSADKRVHTLGKGVTRFHAVYWPAMLMSAGMPLPTDIFVHGYVTAAGAKLSKSSGTAVDPVDLIERYGSEELRYYLLAGFSPYADGDFSEEGLVARVNADLANGLGNLVNRVTAMTVRYRDGVVPAAGEPDQLDDDLAAQLEHSAAEAEQAMTRYDHREALRVIWESVRRTNAYLDERAPWHLAKDAAADSDTSTASAALLDTTLNRSAAALRHLAVLIEPFLPVSAQTIAVRLGAASSAEIAAILADGADEPAGTHVVKGDAVFPRLELGSA